MHVPHRAEASELARVSIEELNRRDRWGYSPTDSNIRSYALMLVVGIVVCLTGTVMSGMLLWRTFA